MTIQIGSGNCDGSPSRPLGPGRNVGPSYRVDRIGRSFRVVSTPYPLHRATVITPTTLVTQWQVVIETADVRTRFFPRGEMTIALQHAGRIIGALYRVDMRSKYSGPQRYMMGRNMCPAKVPCPQPSTCRIETRGHFHFCKHAPDSPLTIWCTDHTDVPEVTGDVFRSLDDSGVCETCGGLSSTHEDMSHDFRGPDDSGGD